MKKTFGPSVIKTAPFKASDGQVISDRKGQMERWTEHYQELSSGESSVTTSALENIQALPETTKSDKSPTTAKLGKAFLFFIF